MKSIKLISIFFGILLLAGVFTCLYFFNPKFQLRVKLIGKDISHVEIEDFQIKGQSMEPLLSEGTKVKGLINYYEYNPVKKNEIAVIKFKTMEDFYVKKIVGLPGDVLEFEGENMKLNGKIIKNSAGVPYLFSEQSIRTISTPLIDGKIPGGKYLILSEEVGPYAFDSRQYGFLEKEHLVGRVMW